MPHKRAKRSVREQQRKEKSTDLAPPGAGSTEGIPKSVSRVLDAARIRAEYRQKKRARRDGDDTADADAPTTLKRRRRAATEDSDARSKSTKAQQEATTIEIQPGESLKHFNRRVEDHMRPLVQSAMRASAATERKERRAATTAVNGTARESKARKFSPEEATTTSAAAGDKQRDRPKEFATISSARPRRLNDIATAPPVLRKLPRGAKHSASPAQTKARGVLSMAQRAMMETERGNAIRRYREMRERKAEESVQTPSSS